MQGYNDPQTGIWPQEDSYEEVTPYTTMTDMDYDMSIFSPMVQPLPQVVNADAAAPFNTHAYPTRGALLPDGGFGAERARETAAPSFPPPSTGQYSVPRYFSPSIHGRSGVSIMIDSTTDFGIPYDHQLIAVDQPIYPLGSDQSSFSSQAPNTTLDNRRLTTESIEFTDSPGLAPSPSVSAATSTSIVESCPYEGCQAVFTGSAWRDSLRRHKKNEHEDTERPICPVCHRVFYGGRKDNMKRHIKSQHPEYPLPASRHVRSRRSAPRPAPRRRRL